MNHNNNTNTNTQSILFNNKSNKNYNNYNQNNTSNSINCNNLNKKNDNFNIINNTNLNILNNLNNNMSSSNFNNINPMKNINYFSNSNYNSNHNNNLNMSYNFSPNVNNIINDSMEDIFNISKKREDSFNSCPSLRGNYLSFNTTTDTNNNINYKNNNNNLLLNQNENQNLLSMQKLFLNLNPYTASLMRNNDTNMNNILLNYNTNLNTNNNHFNNQNYNNFNYFKPLESFNINNNLINEHQKKSNSTKGSHNFNGNFGFNIKKFNNSMDGNMSNDNLSNSSIGSNKAQMKKKRTSLFQNGCNKEKDLRDFKRFCDGLKTTMPEYICTQIGSRIMQKYLKRFPSDIRTLLINKLSLYFEKLMCDTYGNYFCQKLYNISGLEQRIIILNCLKNYFINISKNSCGAHAIQFIIGAAQSEEERKIIIECISNHELELAYDAEGTHILQKIITSFPEDEKQNIYDVLFNNLDSLCKDSKGICVIKKLISNIKIKNNKIKLLDIVYNHFIEIAQNPFGNYLIQYIFEECDIDICHKLIEICINNSIFLATQKYSSNIIVKVIDLYSNNKQFNFVEKISQLFFDYNNISELYNNKYGRLVLAKLSKLKTKEEKIKIVKIFEENNDELKREKLNILNELFI